MYGVKLRLCWVERVIITKVINGTRLNDVYSGRWNPVSYTLLQGKAYAPTVQRHFLIKSAHVNAVKVHVASYGRKFSVDWAGFYPCTYCWWHAAGRLIVDKVWEKKLAVSVCSVLQCKVLRKVDKQLQSVKRQLATSRTDWLLTISLPWKFRPILAKRTGNWHL